MNLKNPIINRLTIKIYTILVYIISILIFEIGYCNSEFFATIISHEFNNQYIFSMVRIIAYVIGFVVLLLTSNKFIDCALEVSNNKYKKLIIYIVSIISILFLIYYGIIVIKNPIIVRSISIKMLAILMGNLFIIYVSNNINYNIIVTMATLGILFSITTQYNHAFDEKKHFMSAFNISNLNFDYANNPITDKKLEKLQHFLKYDSIDELLKEPYSSELTTEVNLEDVPSTPATYPFFPYIFSAFGIWIAKILGGSILDMYILGRIFNLIFYTILISIALKIMPFKKNIFAVIFCMPFLILLAASFSIDSFCVGVVAIFIAYCMKIYKESNLISLKHFGILFSLFLLMLTAKSMSYVFVGIIALILPIIKTIKHNKKYIPIIVCVSIILVIIMIILGLYVKNTQVTSDTRIDNTNVSEQINFILHNPKHDINLAINQIKDTFLDYEWYMSLYPENFFTSDSVYVMFVMILFILYVSITEDDYNFELRNKIILLLAVLATFAITSVVLYISCTEVGDLHVNGYQTRYILPILPLLLFTISSKKIKVEKSENRNMKISIISAIFILTGLMQLVIL